MKNLPIIGILAIASLLTGCRSTPTPQTTTPQAASPQAALAQSEATQSAAPQSSIDTVRNGYLQINRTSTLGQALGGTYKNGTWKSFTSEKDATVVEFDASESFGEVLNAGMTCLANDSCAALYKKISDFCDSPAGWDQATKDYHKQLDELEAKLSDVRKQQADLKANHPDRTNTAQNLDGEESKLQAQTAALPEPQNSCLQDSFRQHANDPVAIVVQFTVNHDGTFQYHSNNMGLSSEEIIQKIYN